MKVLVDRDDLQRLLDGMSQCGPSCGVPEQVMFTVMQAMETQSATVNYAKVRSALPDEVQAFAREGRKLDAIRLLRSNYGIGLSDAKTLVEAFIETDRLETEAKALTMTQAEADLRAAAQSALPLLVRLGDFIGNDEKRCEVILALRNALEADR